MSSRLTAARDALHTMLLAAELTRVNDSGQQVTLEPERRHRLPQAGSYPMPCAWVGLTEVTYTSANDVVLTVPLVLAFDGAATAQLAALDDNGAVVWDAIPTVDIGAGPARPQSATVQRLGPDGSSTFGLVTSVRITLATPTLCDSGHLTTF